MKLPLLFASVLVFISNVYSQITIYGLKENSNTELCGEKVLEQKDYENLANSTLYIALPSYFFSDYELEDLKTYFQTVWNYSKLEVIDQEDIKNHENDTNAAFLRLEYFLFDHPSYKHTIIYQVLLNLSKTNKVVKKNETLKNDVTYATQALILTERAAQLNVTNGANYLADLCNRSEIVLNFKPGLIANYLSIIQYYVSNKLSFCTESVQFNSKLINLKTDTLFITDNILNSYEKSSNPQIIKIPETKIMGDYPYPYKIISYETLNTKIMNNESFYYLAFNYHWQIYHSKSVGFLFYYSRIPSVKIPDYKKDIGVLTKQINKM